MLPFVCRFPFLPFRFTFPLHHGSTFSLYRFHTSLLLFHEINRVPSDATEYSKFLNGRSRCWQTNEDERLNTTSLQENTLENATVSTGENKIYPAQNALRIAPDAFCGKFNSGRSASSSPNSLFGFSKSVGETWPSAAQSRPHRSWRFHFTDHEFRKARWRAVNL